VALDLDGREFLHPIDVDKMRRPCQPERHDRDETLPAGQHAPVLWGDLRQHRDRLGERLRCVIAEGGGFHRPLSYIASYGCGRPPQSVPYLGLLLFFGFSTLLKLCKVSPPPREPHP